MESVCCRRIAARSETEADLRQADPENAKTDPEGKRPDGYQPSDLAQPKRRSACFAFSNTKKAQNTVEILLIGKLNAQLALPLADRDVHFGVQTISEPFGDS